MQLVTIADGLDVVRPYTPGGATERPCLFRIDEDGGGWMQEQRAPGFSFERSRCVARQAHGREANRYRSATTQLPGKVSDTFGDCDDKAWPRDSRVVGQTATSSTSADGEEVESSLRLFGSRGHPHRVA